MLGIGKNTGKMLATLTKRVLGAKMEWPSTPFRYAFTSGMPDPAAAGAMNAQSAAAQIARIIFSPANAANAW